MNAKHLIAAVLLLLAVSVQAEEPAVVQGSPTARTSPQEMFADITPEQWAALVQQRMAETSKRLKLSDEQKEKLRPIMMEQVEKFRALAQQSRGDSKREMLGLMREARALRDESEARIYPLLTEAQQEEATKLREERQARNRDALQKWRGGDEDAVRNLLFPELKTPADKS